MAGEYSALLKSLGIADWVYAPGQVSREQAHAALLSAHQAVIVSESAQSASEWPGGKIYDCLRCGAWILATGTAGSAKDRLLAECGERPIIELADVNAIKERIVADFRAWERGEWKPRLPVPALRAYEASALATRYVAILNRVAAQR